MCGGGWGYEVRYRSVCVCMLGVCVCVSMVCYVAVLFLFILKDELEKGKQFRELAGYAGFHHRCPESNSRLRKMPSPQPALTPACPSVTWI